MDYRTLFFSNIASMTVFTVCMILLACYNRSLVGMSWFAASLTAILTKLILQGLEGKLPVISGMIANELYLLAIVMQMLGLRWFVVRKPLRSRWPWIALGIILAIYTVMYLGRIQYGGNVINIPFVLVCGASAWILLKHGRGPFAAVSRVTALILIGEMVVAAYRAMLTNMLYVRPWQTVFAQKDPRWQYSLATMFFLATFMVMCELWFLETELQWELAEQARTDALTGALNRRALEEMALREAARSLRHGNALCMIVMDIDEFKQINDTRGHAAGDTALRALVKQAKTMLRAQDIIARTGGEEFTILLPDTHVSAGVEVAERVRQAIEALEVPFETGPIRFTVSQGVAQFSPVQGDWENMMRRADRAMYEAKELGRNRVATLLTEAESSRPVPEVF
ncbi:MAG TPA: GGDEF domain-containing protein [Acidobacteriaceae bacterium]|nr:GGDEF domain-containing protein [Acidobacteriaceae bacterium]